MIVYFVLSLFPYPTVFCAGSGPPLTLLHPKGPGAWSPLWQQASQHASPFSLIDPAHNGQNNLWISALLYHPSSPPRKCLKSPCSQEKQIRRRDKEEVVKEIMSLASVACVKGSSLKAYANRSVY